MPVDRGTALRVITALKRGTNCLEATEEFSAGREIIIEAAEESFEDLEQSNGSEVRWIKGSYGQGKTHLFSRLIGVAHGRKWASTYVQITTKGQGTELHRFEEVYAAIVRNILCSDLIAEAEGEINPGQVAGLEWMLDKWFSGLRRLAGGAEGGEIGSFRLESSINQALTMLRNRWRLHAAFFSALEQYAFARRDNDEAWRQTLLSWFQGIDVLKQGGEVRNRLRGAGIVEAINRRNAKEMLRSLCGFLRYRGFKGFLILFDEVENVLQETKGNRRGAYTILRELIDNVNDRHGITHTAFYIAGTPDLFDSATGIVEYEALAARVLLDNPSQRLNPRGVVIDLSLAPFEERDFLTMADRITNLHAIARQWDATEDAKGLWSVELASSLQRNPDLTPRAWIRQLVDTLEERRDEARGRL